MIEIIISFIIVLICIIFSGLYSGSETGFISMNKVRLKHLVENKDKKAKLIHKLLKDPDKFLATVLVGTNLTNIMASAFATYIGMRLLISNPDLGATIASIIMIVLVLLFGEIIPKSVFRQNANTLPYRFISFINISKIVFYPLVSMISIITTKFLGEQTKQNKKKHSVFVTKDEIRLLVKEGEKEGVLERHEMDMIHRIFTFGETQVKEVMVPLSEATLLKSDMSAAEIIKIAKKEGFTRFPVYKEQREDIIGILNIYDVLYAPGRKWQSMIRKGHFIPESKSIHNLIREMQRRHDVMSIIVNEFGGCEGVATLVDLMEEIVGEIDDDETTIKKKNSDTAILDAKEPIHNINKTLGLNVKTKQFETLGGLVMDKLGRIPDKGEMIPMDGFDIVIEEVEMHKIKSIKIIKRSK